MRSTPLLPAREAPTAPPWSVARWFNAPDGVDLERLVGRVVVLEAFQMLCPGCVSHGLPQARRVREAFSDEVAVIGLHTVFEHHEVMSPAALEAFLHEYRIAFPVGVDAPSTTGPIPVTMRRYGLRGTPSLVLIDRAGRLRAEVFGRPDDLAVGAAIGTLLAERAPEGTAGASAPGGATRVVPGCTDDGCPL